MQVNFSWDNPQAKARNEIDKILNKGTDQIAIACAFCTAAGVELLKHHAPRLRQNDSFLVVSAELPTDLKSLEELHEAAPGHIFVHYSPDLPYENNVGRSLMHSKVFYSRTGDKCWLWTGSHNLTASATQGVNFEAAIRLEGHFTEAPFVEALRHLEKCKKNSIPYSPGMVNTGIPSHSEAPLIIHAEADEEIDIMPGRYR